MEQPGGSLLTAGLARVRPKAVSAHVRSREIRNASNLLRGLPAYTNSVTSFRHLGAWSQLEGLPNMDDYRLSQALATNRRLVGLAARRAACGCGLSVALAGPRRLETGLAAGCDPSGLSGTTWGGLALAHRF